MYVELRHGFGCSYVYDISKSDLVMFFTSYLQLCLSACLDLYIYVAVWLHFSVGSQLGYCINREKVICYQLELGKYLAEVKSERIMIECCYL